MMNIDKKYYLSVISTALCLLSLASTVEAQKLIPYSELDVAVWKYRSNSSGTGNGGERNLIDPDKADTDPSRPIVRVDPLDPSTWTLTGQSWASDWQGPSSTDAFTATADDPWIIFDLGSDRNLEKMHIWNVSESTGWTRGIATFNLYYSSSPTTPVSWSAKSSSLPSAATLYDFQGGGWTQFGGTHTVDRGSDDGYAIDLEIDFAGGVTAARYIGIEIKSNLGDGVGRAGLNAVVFTEVDTNAPVIQTVSPADGTTDVPTHQDLVITFDETIATNTGNITITNLTDSTASIIPMGDGQITISGSQLTVDQSAYMDLGDNYAVLLDNGAVEDVWGNSFTGISDSTYWEFSTTPQGSPTATVNAATDVFAISATLNAVLSSGGEADAWLVWDSSIPGASNVVGNWANVISLGTVSQDAAISTNLASLTASQTYYYRLFASNVVSTSWSVTTNFTTGSSANTINASANGPNGSGDTWNNPANWSDGFVVRETQSAVVDDGITAQVQSASPLAYSGELVISNNATLRINNTDGSEKVLETPSGITMHQGSTIYFSLDEQADLVGIHLAGDAMIDHGGNPNDHDTRNINGAITGAGTLTMRCVNNVKMRLKTSNSFSGGLLCEASDRWHLHFDASGAAGTGDITVNPRLADGRSATLNFNAVNAVADTATLYLNGGGYSGGGGDRIIMNADDTIFALYIDGVQMPGGTYTSTDDFISSGSGTLTVLDSPVSITNTTATNILYNAADLVSELYGPSETYDVYLHYSTNDNADAAAWLADGDAVVTNIGSFADYNNATVTGAVSGLSAETTYYYTMMATNVKKFVWASPNATFDTLPAPAPPTATNLGASAQVSGGATLNGELATGGSANAWIIWDDSDQGTNSISNWANAESIGVVAEGVPFSTDVTGILYGNSYSYRAYVSNIAGTGWSDVESFQPNGELNRNLTISFTNFTGRGTLTNFPLLVKLDSTNTDGYDGFLDTVNGYDLRFYDNVNLTGTALDYEIEVFDTNATSYVWVKVPTLTQDGAIWATWGSDATQQASTTNGNTWSEGFAAVYHLNGNANDATANGNDGSAAGGDPSPTNTSVIGGAYDFDGNDDINAPDDASLDLTDAITLSGWFRAGAWNQWSGIISKGSDNAYEIEQYGGSGQFRMRINNASGQAPFVSGLSLDTWYYITGTYDKQNAILYLNGNEESSIALTSSINNNNTSLSLGDRSNNDYFTGQLDEMRVSSVARSADWVWAEYINQGTEHDSFVSYTYNNGEAIETTSATNILATSADIQGTVTTRDAIYTVTAFWSTNDNADGTAWLADSAASSNVVASYTNVLGQALSFNISGLVSSTTNFYTFRAHNAFTSLWAAANASFTTLDPPAPPVASLNGGVTNVGIGVATIQGVMQDAEAAEAYLVWGSSDGGTNNTADWDNVIDIGVVSSNAVFTNALSELLYGVEYNYRVFVTNSTDTDWSDLVTFETLVPGGGGNALAAGGTTTSYELNGTNFVAHIFTSSGDFTLDEEADVEVLIVGGGGGGGSSEAYSGAGAGAGGAGGLVYTNLGLSAGTVTVTIGAGGAGGSGGNNAGVNGGNSEFGSIVALGGGAGPGGNANGNSGGSGSGKRNGTPGAALQPGSASGGFGHAGGAGTNEGGGSGGGGAGGAGVDTSNNDGTAGGVGMQFDISGTTAWYAAGGGGGAKQGASIGLGGSGIGGNGANDSTDAAPGVANTGSGGGGGNNNKPGASGASGVVIVRYASQSVGVGIQDQVVTNIGSTVVTVIGSLDATGSVFNVHGYVSTNNNADVATWLADGDATSTLLGTYTNVVGQEVSGQIGGLTSGTTYYSTLIASNAATNLWAGTNLSFITLAPPIVTLNGGAQATSTTSADLLGLLTVGGSANAYVCWGESDGGNSSTASWENVVSVGLVNQDEAFTNAISGLYYGLEYNYRVYVTNSAGADWSDVDTFTTLFPDGGYVEVTGWSYAAWTGDADSGIDSARNYTAAHSFGNNNGTVSVNGVDFSEGFANSGTGWSITGTRSDWDGDDDAAITGESEKIGQEFIYNADPRGVTFSGLTPGIRYRATFYSVAWEAGDRIHTFSADGTGLSTNVNQSEYGNNYGITISCVYDATNTSQGFTIDSIGSSSHLYALSNRDVEELPSIEIENNSTTNLTSSAVQLLGSLDTTGSVVTAYAYYSTNSANTNAAAWLADGSALTSEVGAFTNVVNESLSVSISGLTPETTYYYTFMATNLATNIWATPSANFTTYPDYSITNVSVTSVEQTTATLNGTTVISGTNANIYAYWGTVDATDITPAWDTNAFVSAFTNVIDQAFTYDLTGLSSEQTYYYRFYLTNGETNLWASPSGSFLTKLGTDQAPVFTSVSATWGGADLVWTDNASAETGYILQRATSSGGPYAVLATLAANATSYSDTTASQQTTYYYQLAATSSVTVSSTDFADAQTSVTTDAKPYSQLGILDVDANSGVNPATGSLWAEGDQYRLVFVSSSRTNATSVFIDDYNNFVQGVAEGSSAFPNLGEVTWKAIGSTSIIDARDNTETNPNEDGSGVAIFMLNSGKIADDYADLWDSSIDQKLHITEENAAGASHDGAWGSNKGAWTGTDGDGTVVNALGSATPRVGLYNGEINANWIDRGTDTSTELAPMYAMSEPLTMRGLITILNQTVSDVISTGATLNAELLIPASDAEVSVYWGTSDGGLNPNNWATNATVGTWTNQASTNVSFEVIGLTSGQIYYYTFFASNAVASYWANPSLSFTALGVPAVNNNGGASSVLDTTATLNGEMTAGGVATAYIVWGDNEPGSPQDTNNWDTVVEIGSIGDSTFSTDLTGLTGSTAYYYSCFVTNAQGSAWSPVTNFTTLSTVNTMTSGGTANSWTNDTNWSLGHPASGTENVVIDTGVYADVNDATVSAYDGNLLMRVSSTLRIWTSAATNAFGGIGRTITMLDGSRIAFRYNGDTDFSQSFEISGNVTIAGSESVGGNHRARGISGSISGTGKLTLSSPTNNRFDLKAANSFAGIVELSGSRGSLVAKVDDALSAVATLTIGDNNSLSIDGGLSDTIHDQAVLELDGNKDSDQAAKLILNSNETVYQLWTDGVQQDGGDYTSAKSWINGSGTLTVLDWPASITNTGAINIITNAADMVGTLDAINEEWGVTLYWSTNNNASGTAWLNDVNAFSLSLGTYSNEVSITGSVSSLDELTTYYYTMRATNATEDTMWASPNASFTTPGAEVAPTVTTASGASGIDIGVATLNAVLTVGGQANAWICWGATDGGISSTNDWENVISFGEVLQGVAFSNQVSGLLYGVEYDYRTYAENGVDSDWSDVAVFSSLEPQTGIFLRVTSGLEARYAANEGLTADGSDNVTAWQDQSGNGRHLIVDSGTPTLVADEVNNLPAINFNASGEGLSLADLDDEYFSKETWLVFRSNNGTTTFRGWSAPFGPLDQGSDSDRSWMFENGTARFWDGEPPAEVTRNGADVPNGGDNRYNMSPADMGQFMVLRVVTGSGSGTQPRAYAVGTRNDQWSDGRYMTAEVLAYSSTNTIADRNQVGSYLASKYGLTTSYTAYDPVRLGVDNTYATNVTSSTALLQGTLYATQSVFTVTAYWSPNNNASALAWQFDGDASSKVIGTYTNVYNHAISTTISGLDRLTTYYYTLKASNDAETIWASPNKSFPTLGDEDASTVFRFR